MGQPWEPVRSAINELLDDEKRSVEQVVEIVRRAVSEYGQLTAADITPGVRGSIRLLFPMLRDHREPSEEQLAPLDETGVRRARQGIAVEPVLRAIRAGSQGGWELLSDRARGLGAQPAALLEAYEHLSRLTDLLATRTAAAHRRADMALVRREHQYHVDSVRGVLLGRRGPGELANQVVALGLDLAHHYFVCRARPVPPGSIDELELALAATADDEREPVLASLERDVVGLLPTRPRIDEGQGWVVGLSEPALPGDAPAAFRQATRAAQTALLFGLTGVHDLRSLGVRAAVVNDPEMTAALTAALVEPLRTGRDFEADVERSVVAFLDNNMRFDQTAEALSVHPNTLRQRLRRYAEITGADLRRTDDLVAVWWAFQHPGRVR